MTKMKSISGILPLALVLVGTHSAQEFQFRYTRVDSYEVRPGILAMPKYAKDGTVCQVSIEKMHVQPDAIEVGEVTMPHQLVLELIDELAPPAERGEAVKQLGGLDYIDEINGSTDVAIASYQNISVQIFRLRSEPGDAAVILQWKRKPCPPFKISKTPVR